MPKPNVRLKIKRIVNGDIGLERKTVLRTISKILKKMTSAPAAAPQSAAPLERPQSANAPPSSARPSTSSAIRPSHTIPSDMGRSYSPAVRVLRHARSAGESPPEQHGGHRGSSL